MSCNNSSALSRTNVVRGSQLWWINSVFVCWREAQGGDGHHTGETWCYVKIHFIRCPCVWWWWSVFDQMIRCSSLPENPLRKYFVVFSLLFYGSGVILFLSVESSYLAQPARSSFPFTSYRWGRRFSSFIVCAWCGQCVECNMCHWMSKWWLCVLMYASSYVYAGHS